MIIEVIKRIKYCIYADRIGPDIPFTHWMLHFNSTMNRLCKKKMGFFGKNAEVRAGAYIEKCSNVHIGNDVVIRPTTIIFASNDAKIIIEDNVLIGSGVHFYVDNHKFDKRDIPIIEQGYYSKDIIVQEGSWIGANSIILAGVTIGKNAVIGAGSIVTKDVKESTVVVGNPAKVIKEING